MKINEKNLCSFASSPPVDLEGWLNKKGEVNKNFQKRWFVLKGNLLFYFEKKQDKEPLGMIILEGCTIELAEEVSEPYCFQIIFHGPNDRTYLLSADTQVTCEKWMKTLTCAGYDYMKLMIAELQRQLEEIGSSPENTPIQQPKAPPRRQNPFNKNVSPAHSSISPCVSRAAPAPPVNGNAHKEDTAPITVNSVNDYFSGVDNEMSTPAVEYTFLQLHSELGKPIMDEIKARKAVKLKAEQPLIFL